ncbi:MAG: hypothetical protein POH28_05315, partial [Acidocella sp.]|nr:hypothetical protein [Acidocella sp.]
SLRLPAATRLAYLLLWPHVKGGKQGSREPLLRCIPQPEHAAAILSQALRQTIATGPASLPAVSPILAHAA